MSQHSRTTLYAQMIAPQEKKIIWYPLHELPVITPTQRIGTAPVPQGREKRNDVIISTSPDAQPGKQLLWRPDSEKQVEKEIPAPNLVAVEAKRDVEKTLKVFNPPPPATPAEDKPAELPTPPQSQSGAQLSNAVLPSSLEPAPVRKPVRSFVPPTAQQVWRQTTDNAMAPAPSQNSDPRTGAGNAHGVLDSLLGTASAKPQKPFVAPPFVAPPGAKAAGTGSSPVSLAAPPTGGDVNAIVLSASPVDKLLAVIPEGSRSARISGAPTVGQTASGAGGSPTGLQIAGVAVYPGAPPASGGLKLPPPPGQPVYEETRVAATRATLSAPLRPSSRTIPQPIESRFQGRVVYSMIVSKPQMPMYAGDWILWFAEKEPKPGNAPQVRSPLPVRKVQAISEQPATHPTGRVQLAAWILKNGHVDSVSVLNGAMNASSQAAVRDFQCWQFAPALRAGEAVDVEIIIDIGFQEGGGVLPMSTRTSDH